MDYATYTLKVEGISGGNVEAEPIARALAEARLAGREDAFHAYAFDRDYTLGGDGTAHFGNAGEVKDEPEILSELGALSERFAGVLFVLDGHVPGEGGENDDRFRVYFKGGRSHHARRVVTYEPFDEGKLD